MIHRSNDEIGFGQLVTMLWRRWKLIAGCIGAAVILLVVIGLSRPDEYTAKAQLLIDSPGTGSPNIVDDAAIETHVELLTSARHIRLTQASLAKGSGAGLKDDSPASEATRATVDGDVPGQKMSDVTDDDESTMENVGSSDGPIYLDLDEIYDGLYVYKERNSRVIAVTFTSTDPEIAAVVANRVARLYIELGREHARKQREKAIKQLDERIPSARAELDRAEAAVREYRADFGIPDTTGVERMARQVAEFKRQLEAGVSNLAERDARLALLRSYQNRAEGLPLLVEALNDPQLTALLRAQTGEQPRSTTDTVQGAAVKPGARELETEQRKQINETVDNLLDRLTLDRDATEARVQDIRQRLETLQRAQREGLRESELRLSELERMAVAAGQVYEGMLRRRTEVAAQDGVQQVARIVSAATEPAYPSSPSLIIFILPTLFAAGFVGCIGAVVFEILDRRLRSERDVEAALGIPCIGLVPEIESADSAAVQRKLIDGSFDPYIDAIRSTVAAALAKPAGGADVFLVTSSRRGEGRTTLAISFATYAALLGRSVVLIDLDLRKPDATARLEKSEEAATADQSDRQHSAEIIRRLPALGFDYMPLSSNPEYAHTILSTDKLPNVLAQLKKRYDCIVIDTSPLLGSPEARLFASFVDTVIFTVHWGAIDAELARAALYQLRHSGIRDLAERVSAVITRVDVKQHQFGRYDAIDDLPNAGVATTARGLENVPEPRSDAVGANPVLGRSAGTNRTGRIG